MHVSSPPSSPPKSLLTPPSSSASSGGNKRTHSDIDPHQTDMAQAKRVKKATSKAAPDCAPAPLVGTRSSGRIRKAPERFTNYTPAAKPAITPARKTRSRVFDPVYMTTNSNSRLKKTDLFHLLLKDQAWTCLTSDQKLKILCLLPTNPINVKLATDLRAGTATTDARPKEVSLNFDLFRTDVAKFKEDLQNGHLSKTWQVAAEQAVARRAAGAFDDWKEREAELWWGQN